MNGLTKSGFLLSYARKVIETYDWARDAVKLARFLDSVRRTITTQAATWNHSDSDVARDIWREHGGKGRPALKALRGSPD